MSLVPGNNTVVRIGPFKAKSTFSTPVTNLAGTMQVYLAKNQGVFILRQSSVIIIYDTDAWYLVPLSDDDLDTPGNLFLQVRDETVHTAVWHHFTVRGR